jgi:hypothetical protein
VLPTVLSAEEITRILDHTTNLKLNFGIQVEFTDWTKLDRLTEEPGLSITPEAQPARK